MDLSSLSLVSLALGVLSLFTRTVHSAHLPNVNVNPGSQTAVYYGRLSEIYPEEEGEPVSVQFVSRIRSRREVSRNDYHILRLNRPSTNETVDIHLVRNDEIDQTDGLHEDGSIEQGLYSGRVSQDQDPQGSVALTLSTDQEEGGLEVNGYLVLRDELFVIEPNPGHERRRRRRRRAIAGKHHHRMYNVQTVVKNNSTHNKSHSSDVLRVPQAELEKAYKEMGNRNSTLNSNSTETEDDDDDPEAATDIASAATGTEDTTGSVTTVSSPTLLVVDLEDSSDQISLETLAGSGKAKASPGKGSKSQNKGTKKPAPASIHRIVELAIFSDPKLYEVWQGRYPKDKEKDTKGRMKAFILSLVHNMNLLYQHQSLGLPLSFRLVHLGIMTSYPVLLDGHTGVGDAHLQSFCHFAGDKNVDGSKWDHAVLLTGFDIHFGDEMEVQGQAYFATMCLQYWSCSIIEATGFLATFILTHELGHSLGMEHDGSGVSEKCDSEKDIMSPSTGTGKVNWSSCSRQSFKDFVTKGDPAMGEKGDGVNIKPTCLTKASPLKKKSIKFTGAKLPGQIYGTKAQCHLTCGSGCSPSVEWNTDICSLLWCDHTVNNGTHTNRFGKGIQPALEGTPCGTDKYCRYGKCVKSPKAG